MESELGFDRQVAAALVADFLCAERGMTAAGRESGPVSRIVAFDSEVRHEGGSPWHRRRRKPHRFLSRGTTAICAFPPSALPSVKG